MALPDFQIPDRNFQIIERTYQIARAFGLERGVVAAREGLKLISPYVGEDDKVGRKGYLGTKVFSNLSISADQYANSNGQVFQFPDLNFDVALFEVKQTKNIIYTAIQGKDGTVKEYIGNGDFDVTIRGVIAGTNGRYPDKNNGAQVGDEKEKFVQTVDNLIIALQSNQPIAVNSWYLAQLGIYDIVVTDWDLPQEEGMYSVQRFTFNAKSDTPFTVVLDA